MNGKKIIFASLLISMAVAAELVFPPAFAQKRGSASNGSPSNQEDVYAPLGKAPKKAAARRNPMENDSDAVSAGGNLFAEHCAECHGEMAEGGRKAPSLLADPVQQATPGTLFWILTNGVVRRGMPVWSKLPEPERWQLVTYIKSLQPGEKTPKSAPQ